MNTLSTTLINTGDPMGLKRLQNAIHRLSALRGELPIEGERPARWVFVVEQIETAMSDVETRYELLKDRYSLLKRANAALCDELVWLRDHLDDLSPETHGGE